MQSRQQASTKNGFVEYFLGIIFNLFKKRKRFKKLELELIKKNNYSR